MHRIPKFLQNYCFSSKINNGRGFKNSLKHSFTTESLVSGRDVRKMLRDAIHIRREGDLVPSVR
jgi:hypothetical protein